jgi:hypothetical protein
MLAILRTARVPPRTADKRPGELAMISLLVGSDSAGYSIDPWMKVEFCARAIGLAGTPPAVNLLAHSCSWISVFQQKGARHHG